MHEVLIDHKSNHVDVVKSALVKTDYVLGEQKVGRNAQSIVKGGCTLNINSQSR
jgi:hypothetical protein